MNTLGASVCAALREDETFRRFMAMCAWTIKMVCLALFLTTVRLNEPVVYQERAMREVNEEPVVGANPRRHQRVAYRHLLAREPAHDRLGSRDD